MSKKNQPLETTITSQGFKKSGFKQQAGREK